MMPVCIRWSLLVVFIIGMCGSGFAQPPVWELVYQSGPSPRYAHAMVYDAAREKVLLFGGGTGVSNSTSFHDDTWEWDGDSWTQRFPSSKPSSRYFHAMAYDPGREKVVLFGGHRRSDYNDTWEWDGNTWEEKNPADSPPVRSRAGMFFDPARDSIVLFGGSVRSGASMDDMWEWDGTNWTEVIPTTRPSARHTFATAYDLHNHFLVLFGGLAGPLDFSDTWIWDGEDWKEVFPASHPSERHHAAMAYDASRGTVVLFGGTDRENGSNPRFDETWELNGAEWEQIASDVTPLPRGAHSMAYDTSRKEIVLFGGIEKLNALGDTWVYNVDNSPPIADAGEDQVVEANRSGGADGIQVDGTGSSDPDGDPLTFTWTGPFGTIPGATAVVNLDLGNYGIGLSVSDGQEEDSDSVIVQVVDTTPPQLTVPSDMTVEGTSPSGAVVDFAVTATDICDPAPTVVCTPPSGSTFTLGTTPVMCIATDASGNVAGASFTVSVVDTTPPEIESLSASPDVLWPPNHKMVEVSLSAVVSDICDPSPACRIVSVSSSEPANGQSDGNTESDWEITGDMTAELRAERSGTGEDRVYTVRVECTDASGNSTTGTATVVVPHDQGNDKGKENKRRGGKKG